MAARSVTVRTLAISVLASVVIGALLVVLLGSALLARWFRAEDFAYIRLSDDAGRCSVAGSGTGADRTVEHTTYLYSEQAGVTWRVINDSASPCWVVVGEFQTTATAPTSCRQAGAAFPFMASDLGARTVAVDARSGDSPGKADLTMARSGGYAGGTLLHHAICTAASAGDASNGGRPVGTGVLRIER